MKPTWVPFYQMSFLALEGGFLLVWDGIVKPVVMSLASTSTTTLKASVLSSIGLPCWWCGLTLCFIALWIAVESLHDLKETLIDNLSDRLIAKDLQTMPSVLAKKLRWSLLKRQPKAFIYKIKRSQTDFF